MSETTTPSQVEIDVFRGSIEAKTGNSDSLATLSLDDWLDDPQAVTEFVSTLVDLFEDGDTDQDAFTISVDDTSVAICNGDNTLLSWRCDEWAADPALVYTVVRAVSWAYENPSALQASLSVHPTVEMA